jgi:hypothetical protein
MSKIVANCTTHSTYMNDKKKYEINHSNTQSFEKFIKR